MKPLLIIQVIFPWSTALLKPMLHCRSVLFSWPPPSGELVASFSFFRDLFPKRLARRSHGGRLLLKSYLSVQHYTNGHCTISLVSSVTSRSRAQIFPESFLCSLFAKCFATSSKALAVSEKEGGGRSLLLPGSSTAFWGFYSPANEVHIYEWHKLVQWFRLLETLLVHTWILKGVSAAVTTRLLNELLPEMLLLCI